MRALPVADEASNKEWQRSTIGKRRQPAQTESGNATGIVRRTEECVIIGQTAPSPHKHKNFHWFAPPDALVSKTGFWAILERSGITF